MTPDQDQVLARAVKDAAASYANLYADFRERLKERAAKFSEAKVAAEAAGLIVKMDYMGWFSDPLGVPEPLPDWGVKVYRTTEV